MKIFGSFLWAAGIFFLVSGCTSLTGESSQSKEPTTSLTLRLDEPSANRGRVKPVVGSKGMVVARGDLAGKWGTEILRRGGNAMDAAVATAFMLAVTRPESGSIGGGGFLNYCPAPKNGKIQPCTTLDYREKAPIGSTRDQFLDDQGNVVQGRSSYSGQASGVPGVVAGLLEAHRKYGKRSRKEILSQPIEKALKGVRLTGSQEAASEKKWKRFNLAAKKILSCDSQLSQPCLAGTVIRQKDLARVLKEISLKGRDGFYKGWVSRKVIAGVNAQGGIFTQKDFDSYQPVWRPPVRATIGGFEFVSMGPPSAGGMGLIQMLSYADFARQKGLLNTEHTGRELSVSGMHVLAHAMNLAYADRAHYFGDPDFVSIPRSGLLSKKYLHRRWNETFLRNQVSLPAGHGNVEPESSETTHFSVIDRWGGAVSVTTTINYTFGSGVVPQGTGVFMNNEMDDFSVSPGVPNAYGLVGAEANSVASEKRPLSSMSPTIVRDDQGQVRLVLGASGGSRIPTSVFQVLFKRIFMGFSLSEAMVAPRFHHQWKPEPLFLEVNSFPQAVFDQFQKMGYTVRTRSNVAQIQAIERFPESRRVWGVPDIRSEGVAVPE